MSQQSKLEQILDFLVNEETEKAEDLLHDLVVEKARNIYEELVNEEDDDEAEMDEEMEESIGGDMKQDFVGEIEAAKEDIQADELQDGHVSEDEDEDSDDEEEHSEHDYDGDGEHDDHEEDHMDVEDKVEDLEKELEELRADFERLMADEMEEPYHDEEDFNMDMDSGEGTMGDMEDEMPEGMYEDEALEEATKLQHEVPGTGQETESGKLAGTGAHSKTGATGKEAPYTNAPSKSVDGSDPVDFTKGTAPEGGSAESAKDHTPSSNIDENPSDVSHGEQTAEGDFVGTGKGSKKGATNTDSPLTDAPKKP